MLPTTPKFKGNVEARYTWPIGSFEAHAQAAYVYQTYSWEDLRTVERELLGRQKPFGLADLSFGLSRNKMTYEVFVNNLLDKREDLYRYSECPPRICPPPPLPTLAHPPHAHTPPAHPPTIPPNTRHRFPAAVGLGGGRRTAPRAEPL